MLPGAAYFILFLLMLYLAGALTEKRFFRVIRHKKERREMKRPTTCPIYLFFLSSLIASVHFL